MSRPWLVRVDRVAVQRGAGLVTEHETEPVALAGNDIEGHVATDVSTLPFLIQSRR